MQYFKKKFNLPVDSIFFLYVDQTNLEYTEIYLPFIPSAGIKSKCHQAYLLFLKPSNYKYVITTMCPILLLCDCGILAC